MNSLNKVQLIGNLTADPEIKQTPNGQFVANFSIATNRTWKDTSGTKQEQVEFHNVVLWGRLAEIAQQYIKKGKKVYIEGRLQTRNWEDQTGVKRYKTEVVGENLIMLGSPTGNSTEFTENTYESPISEPVLSEEVSPIKTKKTSKKQEEEINIEDIPF
ncbi:single-stranded DNA-binding protein [Candidatus Gracilibacteria bacterium]|nr:single-stranded DNA-binding protein [Candidatus Gracilibacteria bacterium]